jgi:hypothetical protein
MLDIGTISPEDLELVMVTDDAQEAIDYIKKKIPNLVLKNENADVY